MTTKTTMNFHDHILHPQQETNNAPCRRHSYGENDNTMTKIAINDSPFSSVEQYVLSSILLEPNVDDETIKANKTAVERDGRHGNSANGSKSNNTSNNDNIQNNNRRVLSREMLFSVPRCLDKLLHESNRRTTERQNPLPFTGTPTATTTTTTTTTTIDPHANNNNNNTISSSSTAAVKRPAVARKPKDYRLQVGLWQAHEEGVTHRHLTKMASVLSTATASRNGDDDDCDDDDDNNNDNDCNNNNEKSVLQQQHQDGFNSHHSNTNNDRSSCISGISSILSDEEVRPTIATTDNDDDVQSGFSLDDDDDDNNGRHFDAWQVLKDEYAQDFGFDYTPGRQQLDFDDDDDDSDSDDLDEEEEDTSSGGDFQQQQQQQKRKRNDKSKRHNTFKIIGTSVNDVNSHPHVLSPPIMDRILSHVPDHVRGQNFWMRYSLIRDGASIDTFKSYARATKDSILAIETTHGEVFGCYVSKKWKTYPSAFGGPPSFVWRMRSSRLQKAHSLFEQAEMESQVDVWEADESNLVKLQMLTHDRLGVGMGNMNHFDKTGHVTESEQAEEERNGKNYGFAIALEDDLLSGTSSRSPSYKNPCLVDPSSNGEPFETLNCELWTLTPAFTEESAQKLEMTQHFITESIRSSSTSTSRSTSQSPLFSSRDLDQTRFYRHIGKGDEHESLRGQW